jgi:hypothetical protein
MLGMQSRYIDVMYENLWVFDGWIFSIEVNVVQLIKNGVLRNEVE